MPLWPYLAPSRHDGTPVEPEERGCGHAAQAKPPSARRAGL